MFDSAYLFLYEKDNELSHFKIVCVTHCVVCEVAIKYGSAVRFARVDICSARTLPTSLLMFAMRHKLVT